MQERIIEIYTDGSCLGNPGPGGWGAVIIIDGKEEHISGGDSDTTNNRMEMKAIIKALEWLRKDSGISHEDINSHKILIHSDSNLIIQTMRQGWKKKANTDLWAEMDKLRAWLDIDWKWIKGHNNHHYNDLADELAVAAAKKIQNGS